MSENIGVRQEKETYYKDFINEVKEKGIVRASLSHSQTHPCTISSFAILDWQFDGELFALSNTGSRCVCNVGMPAFHIYDIYDCNKVLSDANILLKKLLSENSFYSSAIELDVYVKPKPKHGEDWEEELIELSKRIESVLAV